jgi:hypothetical protein
MNTGTRERFTASIQKACDEYGLEAGSLLRYVEYGVTPGGFLTAVLANDFMGAVGRADSFNKLHLPQWAAVIYNDVPSGCHGSPDHVATWIKAGGLVGMAAENEARAALAVPS